MDNIEGFYVFDSMHNLWLQEDEREWGPFMSAAQFTDHELARDIAKRETGGNLDNIYILGEVDLGSDDET